METIFKHNFEDFGVEIQKDGTGVYTLWWTDYVANEWEEEYPLLSTTLSRLAALAACAESNWEYGFMANPDEHQVIHHDFLASSVG